MATHWTLGGIARDPQRQARFWCLALGYVPEPGFDGPDNASIVDPDGVGPAMGWLRTDEPTPARNACHVDIRVAGEGPCDPAERDRLIESTVAALVAAGATRVREERYDPDHVGHVVMLDPEGVEFCVA